MGVLDDGYGEMDSPRWAQIQRDFSGGSMKYCAVLTCQQLGRVGRVLRYERFYPLLSLNGCIAKVATEMIDHRNLLRI